MRSGVDGPTLIIGEEEYLAEEKLARLLDEAIPIEDRQLNLDVLEGGAPVGELLTRLDTAPFFGPRRVVVIRRLEAMRDADQEALVAYLERGDSPTTGIFIAREMDRRRRLFLTFKRVGTIIDCRPLPQRERPAWVESQFLAAGKTPGRGVAEELAATSGGSLRDLSHEVAKLVAYVGESQQVTAADVQAIASRLGEASIFTLVDAVGGGNAAGALRALHDYLTTHEPLQALFMIVRQFRLIVRAHAAATSGRSSERLAEHLGVHPYVARKIAEQARGYRADQFAGIFDALETADRAIKSGSAPRLILETLIIRLAGRRAPAAQRRAGSRA